MNVFATLFFKRILEKTFRGEFLNVPFKVCVFAIEMLEYFSRVVVIHNKHNIVKIELVVEVPPVVVWYEMNELIDRSGKIFRLGRVDDVPPAPLNEIMHCEKGARLIDIFNDSEWVDFHTGLGTGGMMHRSISDEFFRRTEGMHVSEVRKSWRNIVLEILNEK